MNPLRLGHSPEESGNLGKPVLFRFLGEGEVTYMGLGLPGKSLSQLFFQSLRQRLIKKELRFHGSANRANLRRRFPLMYITANRAAPFLDHLRLPNLQRVFSTLSHENTEKELNIHRL